MGFWASKKYHIVLTNRYDTGGDTERVLALMRPTFTVIDQRLLIATPEWEWRQFSCVVNM